MKKTILFVLMFSLLCGALIACNGGNASDGNESGQVSDTSEPTDTSALTSNDTETTASQTETTSDEEAPISILFIGNSYTYYNDMPSYLFKQTTVSAGLNVSVKSITKGSHTLEKFADPTDEYGKKVEEYLNKYTFDYVVLQEQSVRPANDPDKFYEAVRNLSARIRAKGAEPILYSTWGRETGNSTLTNNGWTNESMTWKIAAAYQAIGDELGISVAHVGLAFFDVYTDADNEIGLYASDKHHSSSRGSYLAALTIYATIFNDDPSDITFKSVFLEDEASVLREAAKNAVFNTPEIPEEYRVVSAK